MFQADEQINIVANRHCCEKVELCRVVDLVVPLG